MIDPNKAPYYDRFKPEDKWSKVKFIGDRGLQASELNELQSILSYHLKKIGDQFLTSGEVSKGMGSRVNSAGNLEVDPGEVYLEGRIRIFDGAELELVDGVAPERLYVRLDRRYLTEEDDESLLDQNSAMPGFFSPGAHRVVEEVVVTTDPGEGLDNVYPLETIVRKTISIITSEMEPTNLQAGDQWHRITE